ncbi:hypothetical protein [Streptomyces anulatus]|uniref:hypothetical protein n=1 Tax=Streptomyces anulatus TaxID=1892 RepID=UPI0033EE03A4
MPLLLTVVTAVLLTACAGAESGPASGSATPPARPTPTAPSSPTPSSTRPSSATASPTASPTPSTAAEITEAVTQWYEYGGGTAMVSLIEEAEKAQSGRAGEKEEFALVILDFSGLDEALDTAQLFGSIPDPKTQKTWSAAIERLVL